MSGEYLRKLTEAEILLPESFNRGFPTWRRYGLQVAKRLEESFFEQVRTAGWDLKKTTQSSFVDQAQFETFYDGIHDYSKSVYLSPAGRFLVRCDSFLSCGEMLRDLYKEDGRIAVGVDLSLYRSSDPHPLIVDRRIWPVIGFYVASENSEETLNILYGVFDKFYYGLCLPTFFVYQDDYANYAKRLLMPIVPIDEGNFTVAATIFELSSLFIKKMAARKSIFESGISEKNLTLIFTLQSERDHITLPRKLCPYEVFVLYEEDGKYCAGVREFLSEKEIRFEKKQVSGRERFPLAKKAEEKGVPLVLHLKKEARQVWYWRSFDDKRGTLEGLEEVEDHLNESDNLIRRYNLEKFQKAANCEKNRIDFLCSDCQQSEHGLIPYGKIFPFTKGNCSNCGLPTYKSFFIKEDTSGTIREKIEK